MKFRILAIGKPKLTYAAAGVEEYRKRLRRHARVEVEYLKERHGPEELLTRSEGLYRIALDERGEALTTAALVSQVDRLELRGEVKGVAFLIGGSDGHNEELRQACDRTWSLSALTLQHELALVVLLEQLYRVFTIKRGEPYHR